MANNIVRLRNIKRALAIREPCETTSYLLSGRISNFRPYKSFNFIDLVDGSSNQHLQVVVKKDLLSKPELGAYITCQGKLVPSKGPKQPIEFKATSIQWLGKCDPDSYPLATSAKQSNDWYRRFAHLRPRAAHFGSLLRVRSELELSIHMIMKQMDFFRVHPPSLTSNDSEASSDLFIVKRSKVYKRQGDVDCDKDVDDDDQEGDPFQSAPPDCRQQQQQQLHGVIDDALNGAIGGGDNNNGAPCLHTSNGNNGGDEQSSSMDVDEGGRIIRDGYFNKDVFLITSAQLHLESLASALGRVYSLATCFRAESSISTRHLCEFLMFELEEANITELAGLMNRAELIVKFIAQFLAETSEHKSDFHGLLAQDGQQQLANFEKLARSVYIRMSYREALETLRNHCGDFAGDTRFGADIGRLHEKRLLAYCGQQPIFITHYPKQLKPFYMKTASQDGQEEEVVECFDLIAPHGGEICGGSLREDSHERLLANLRQHHKEQQLDPESEKDQLSHFQWYLDTRRFGSFPHGGFGLGVERLLQSLLGIKNIRDTSAFPRWTGHCPM